MHLVHCIMIFFAFISLALALAASCQFYIVGELDDDRIQAAPLLAGLSLVGSFVFNFAWLKLRSRKQSWSYRVAIVLWTSAITVGVAAAGATLSQLALAGDLGITVPENMQALQWISLVLLVGCVSLPHAYKKQKPTSGIEAGLVPQVQEVKPLIFL